MDLTPCIRVDKYKDVVFFFDTKSKSSILAFPCPTDPWLSNLNLEKPRLEDMKKETIAKPYLFFLLAFFFLLVDWFN